MSQKISLVYLNNRPTYEIRDYKLVEGRYRPHGLIHYVDCAKNIRIVVETWINGRFVSKVRYDNLIS